MEQGKELLVFPLGMPFHFTVTMIILSMPVFGPAMAINDGHNKPIGPGGSTRHLHQIPLTGIRWPPRRTAFDGGELGSTRV